MQAVKMKPYYLAEPEPTDSQNPSPRSKHLQLWLPAQLQGEYINVLCQVGSICACSALKIAKPQILPYRPPSVKGTAPEPSQPNLFRLYNLRFKKKTSSIFVSHDAKMTAFSLF